MEISPQSHTIAAYGHDPLDTVKRTGIADGLRYNVAGCDTVGNRCRGSIGQGALPGDAGLPAGYV